MADISPINEGHGKITRPGKRLHSEPENQHLEKESTISMCQVQ
jgi:hypothetical protein